MKTSKEMYAHVDQWLKTGKTQREYVKALDISKDSFSYWVNKYRREFGNNKSTAIDSVSRNIPSEYSFIQVSEESTANIKSKKPQAEIKLPNGVHIIIY